MADAFAIIVLVILAYMWGARGFFSAFLHMVCCIVAAAIAFALWEPAAYLLMGQATNGAGWLVDLSWTMGLMVPFALVLAVIRPALDKIVPTNLDFNTATNLVGGIACGLVTGFITVGVLMLSLSYLPSRADVIGLTQRGVAYDPSGSLVRRDNLIIRADTVTAQLFTMLAESTFFPDSGETLSKWRPDLANEGPLLRTTFPAPDGGFRHLYAPKSFEVISTYSVKTKGDDWKTDFLNPLKKQSYTDVHGETFPVATVEGVVVKFAPTAKEKTGKVVVGAGQFRLIARNEQEGKSIGVQPLAVISAADGSTGRLGRWRFESPDMYFASVGGGDGEAMAFEFPLPAGYKPLAVVVKGVRQELISKTPGAFETGTARDSAITSGTIANTRVKLQGGESAPTIRLLASQGGDSSVRFGNNMPFGMVVQRDDLRGLEINEQGRITGGEAKFEAKDLQNRGVDRQLQVLGFAEGDDTALMLVDIDTRNTQFGLLTDLVQVIEDKTKAPIFVGENDQQFTPIGYIFEGSNQVWFRFIPQSPIQSLTDDPMVRISKSTPGNKLTLIYRVSKNIKLKQFAIGDKVVVNFKPMIETPK